MVRKKQFSYTAKFKVAFVESNSNRKAERCYGVNEKCVRDWKKKTQAQEDAEVKACR